MAKAKQELSWQEIDPASLPEQQQTLYAEYKQAYAAMKAKRAAFEASLQPAAPQGKRIVVGYNFGKLSLALAGAVAPKADAGTLADWLRAAPVEARR